MTVSKSAPTILIVDDEPVVTKSIAGLLELESNYRVLQFQSPVEALEFLRQRIPDVVVSDFLMPEMNGLQFLAEVKKLYPDVPRIMLTGYADKENSIRAINEVGLFQYIEKPWDNEQLKLVLDGAVANKGLQMELKERIHDLDQLMRERDKLVAREEYLRQELKTARVLQQSMLPKELPAVGDISLHAKYCPALEIGGDFYDVIPLAGDRTGILVADATGHGIQAALSTAILKFAFTRFAHRDVAPSEILEGMNQILLSGLPRDTFIAASVAAIDGKKSRLTLANAGNPYPFLVRRSGSKVERVAANGLALGMVEESLYPGIEEHELSLERGDALLLHTDGLAEAENGSGEQFHDVAFGEALVAHHAKPSVELLDALIGAGREFSASDHEWDDITLFGIEKR